MDESEINRARVLVEQLTTVLIGEAGVAPEGIEALAQRYGALMHETDRREIHSKSSSNSPEPSGPGVIPLIRFTANDRSASAESWLKVKRTLALN